MITRPPALLAVLVVPLVAVLAACSSSSGGNTPGGPATHSPTASVHSSAPHPSTVHRVTRSTTALKRWYRTATPPLNHINNSIVSAQRAVNHGDAAALHRSCQNLRRTVADFASVPTAPNRPINNTLRRAMSNFREAANDCLSGNLDPAGPLVLRGQRMVARAAGRVDGLA